MVSAEAAWRDGAIGAGRERITGPAATDEIVIEEADAWHPVTLTRLSDAERLPLRSCNLALPRKPVSEAQDDTGLLSRHWLLSAFGHRLVIVTNRPTSSQTLI